ncbi:MAG: metal-sulfur cluster assembly factor [Sulfuricella denitrificans]|nr:metal-sulfur cluster assembly factor [Sulfuricella denitrificans]
MLCEEEVRTVLRSVIDPEIGMNIVDLGLVYGVEVSENKLHIDLTMTTPACPMGEMILDDVHEVLSSLEPSDIEIEISLVWEPRWSPERMSDYARKHLGWK